MNHFTSSFFKISVGTAGVLAVLLLWGGLSSRFPSLILPSPLETAQALIELLESGILVTFILITVKRTMIGYTGAIIAGLVFAFFLRYSKFWRLFFRPLITIMQTIPPVVWLVLAVIWFGIADDLTPIFLIFIVSFPVVFINIYHGLGNIDYGLVEMARFYHCSRKQIFFDIYLPSLLPHLMSAISIGLAFAWKSTVFAEFVGSSSGIGFALSVANNNLQTDRLFAWAIVLIVLMFSFEYLIIKPLKKYVMRWEPDVG
ncbi:ABC transporter permease [Halocella sp. SP3-1]|uniref:ABC transporter permease n=1 Tax=Halocella sp. SP3-1 TaxID=2382161 RepID=UPI000F76260A|nr:ABC transporter permease [Halocella sp. SP3-1]AZO93387.1 ABC transporter permease [Halocella sp. SP3-1]